MKKILTLAMTVILTFMFTGCGDEGEETGINNDDVIGIWKGNYGNANAGTIKLDIAKDTWVITFTGFGEIDSYHGSWTRSGNVLSLNDYDWTAIYTDGKINLSISGFTWGTFLQRNGTHILSKEAVIEPETTTLTIKNESFIEITDVIWNSTTFVSGQNKITTGSNVEKGVNPGSGYIYFKKAGNLIPARTSALFTVDEDEKKEFVFTNNTVIVEVSNPANTATVQTFYTKPWIMIKQSSNTIDLYSDFSYGTILNGNQKDLTFTIENIGAETLTITSVDSNRVILDENIDGYFSVIQQPLTVAIAPGGSTNFTIRFEPEKIGNNYSAIVNIRTNSQNVEEFAFRVIGNSRDYIIGDTGPGGGIVFYAQGGQFIECSEELGTNTWDNAVTITSSYNGGGYSDWSLPTRAQLALMYENLRLNNLGGFYNEFYWSSEEYDYYGNDTLLYAWAYNFNTGSYVSRQNYNTKTYMYYRVRAVRSFSYD